MPTLRFGDDQHSATLQQTTLLPSVDDAAQAAAWAAQAGLLGVATALLALAFALKDEPAAQRPRTALQAVREPTPYATATCVVCDLHIYANGMEPEMIDVGLPGRPATMPGRFEPIGWRHRAGDPIRPIVHDARPAAGTVMLMRHIPGTDARPGDDGHVGNWDTAVMPTVDDQHSHAPNQCATCGAPITWRETPGAKGHTGWWGHVDGSIPPDHDVTPAH